MSDSDAFFLAISTFRVATVAVLFSNGASPLLSDDDTWPLMAQKHLRKVKAEAAKVTRAQDGLRRAIVAAQQSGESIRDIAPYAGVSTSKIHEILREAARRE